MNEREQRLERLLRYAKDFVAEYLTRVRDLEIDAPFTRQLLADIERELEAQCSTRE